MVQYPTAQRFTFCGVYALRPLVPWQIVYLYIRAVFGSFGRGHIYLLYLVCLM